MDPSDKDLTPKNTLNMTQKPRIKSPLRMKYEAEAQRIIEKCGNLEDIRLKLGLSQRKICQLLLVDPSAWTRWQNNPKQVPPSVYRALQWYLALNEKYPELQNAFWLKSVARVQAAETIPNSWSEESNKLKSRIIEDLKDHFKSYISESRLEQKSNYSPTTEQANGPTNDNKEVLESKAVTEEDIGDINAYLNSLDHKIEDEVQKLANNWLDIFEDRSKSFQLQIGHLNSKIESVTTSMDLGTEADSSVRPEKKALLSSDSNELSTRMLYFVTGFLGGITCTIGAFYFL